MKTTASTAPRISVIDDDEGVSDFLSTLLRLRGYEVSAYPTAGKFFDKAMKLPPSLILLDLELPGISGWDVLKVLKTNDALKPVPVIIVSARHSTSKDAIQGLGLGADDFVSHPIQGEFLIARIEALLRRSAWSQGTSPASAWLQAGPLKVDTDAHIALLNDKPLRLTPMEFGLLAFFLQNQNKVLTRSFLLENVWKGEPSLTTRTVDKHVECLRNKLGPIGKKIDTVIGVGYVLRP